MIAGEPSVVIEAKHKLISPYSFTNKAWAGKSWENILKTTATGYAHGCILPQVGPAGYIEAVAYLSYEEATIPRAWVPSSVPLKPLPCVVFENGYTYTLTLADDENAPQGYGFKKLVIT